MAERRPRGLGDVLHYFISEDEQRESRAGAPPKQQGRGAAAQVRWAICVEPGRPLASALAIDLAAALTTRGSPTEILSPLAPPFPFSTDAGRPWWRLDAPVAEERLSRLAPGAGALVALSARDLGAWLPTLGSLDGVLVPVDAAARGVPTALRTLRELPRPVPARRIAALVVGAAGTAAQLVFDALADSAERQLDLRLESLGGVPHDDASFRALLRGRPAQEVDANAASTRHLRDVSRRMVA